MNLEVINSLKQDFGFTHHHILILELLEKESLKAEEISQKTEIPMGRIYSYLNFLEEKGLIDKTLRPSIYSARNLQSKLYEFIEMHYNQMMKHKATLLNSLEKAEHLEFMTSVEEYKSKLFDLLKGSKYLHYVDVGTSVPLVFLPESEFEALKIIRAHNPRYIYSDARRKNRELFWKNLGNFQEIKHLVDQSTFEDFYNSVYTKLGAREVMKCIRDTKRIMKKHNIEIRVQEGFPASRMIITDKMMINSFYFVDKFFALKIDSPKIVQSYNEMFDRVFAVATPVDNCYKKFIEEKRLKEMKEEKTWEHPLET